MGREMGGRFKREETYVYLWLIHVEVWQKTTKFRKAIILQLKKIKIKKKKSTYFFPGPKTELIMFEDLRTRIAIEAKKHYLE